MDNLTHSLVGLFLARAGFRNVTPRATAIMVVAANAPDFDAVCIFWGPASYIHWHRNITHSLLAWPVMALLSVALVRWLGRKQVRWKAAFGIAVIGVASHLILDLTNVYGVRLLLPFSGHWFHWDLTPVVDPIIWALLLVGVFAAWFGRLVGSEIGEKKRPAAVAGWAVASLLLVFGYDYARSVLHGRVVAEMNSRVYEGEAPRRTAAFPTGNPLEWQGVAELSGSWVIVPVDSRARFRPQDGEVFHKAARTPALEAAMRTFPFRRFLEFVQYPVWVVEPPATSEDPGLVRLVDLRFGTPARPGFEAIATVTKDDQVVDSEFTMGGMPAGRRR